METIQTIQAIMAPAVMITGVALLLLTLNARHSSLVNRIRLLDDENRHLRRTNELDELEGQRLKSIANQIGQLRFRLLYVRNGMLCHLLAVIFFVFTSFAIGLGYLGLPAGPIQGSISATFIVGMLLVLVGVAYLALEVYVSYRIIGIEISGD
ncbi:MAG: DUF2721 domain-containing protein [Chloroflexota bacterium]|nr:DUF2721 domain-containing protein [Chloroflexota bacterium]